MGMEQEVELLAARVYGSRSRQDLYREDYNLDVVLSYKGDIREDSFFNALNESGIAMAGIKVDINPIAEERITLAEYIKDLKNILTSRRLKSSLRIWIILVMTLIPMSITIRLKIEKNRWKNLRRIF